MLWAARWVTTTMESDLAALLQICNGDDEKRRAHVQKLFNGP